MRRIRLLSILLDLLAFCGAQLIPYCEAPHYKNLYGCTEFDLTKPQLDLIFGTIKTLDLATEFQRASQPDVTPINRDKYDFIVIGAGTGGATVASRLSEWRRQTVLLLEAGDEEVYYMDIPMLAAFQQSNSSLNWNSTTVPNPNYCLSMEDDVCRFPRGRVMGGGSVLNYMLATRGHAEDYNEWARDGNEGWAYKDILKYFKKLENMHIPEYRNSDKHGKSGPIPVTYPPYRTPLATAFKQAGIELGYPAPDYNRGYDTVGVSYFQTSTFNGSRVSSNRGYLHSRLRKNLHVSKRSLVTKILIDREKRAYGVEFVKDGQFRTVYANKEVILSAGAFGSPHLLMLSGIGPREHLLSNGINVIQDLPVGDNFQDHLAFIGLLYQVNQPVSLTVRELLRPGTPYWSDYLLHQTGPFTIPGGAEGVFYNNVNDPWNLTATPDMEYLFASISPSPGNPFFPPVGYDAEVQELLAEVGKTDMWAIVPILLKPKSRGTVRLRSANIEDKLIVRPNFFDHPDDMKIFIAGIRKALEFAETSAMRQFNSTMLRLTLRDCRYFDDNTDEFYDCIARHTSMSFYHYSGTCKMGPRGDPTAVVDPRLKVIGIKGLRVVDASIIPKVPGAHLNLPVYMIAEKAADMIKQSWYNPWEYL